jgi:hypothetical protein
MIGTRVLVMARDRIAAVLLFAILAANLAAKQPVHSHFAIHVTDAAGLAIPGVRRWSFPRRAAVSLSALGFSICIKYAPGARNDRQTSREDFCGANGQQDGLKSMS